ncbi:MAG: hypothetical protein ACJA2H_001170 [Nitriliruptoraceae bacterium]|jgi:hypothetical protein
MQNGNQMKFKKTTRIDASAAEIWAIFAHGFDNAQEWMAGVPRSYGKENGILFEGATSSGRVCELSHNPSGLKASERFLAYDEAAKTCTVRVDFVDPPKGFPVHYNTVSFSVTTDASEQSIITWAFSSKVKPRAYLIWPVIRMAASVGVGQIGEELKRYVETGTPHPRKVKALEKARVATRG